MHRWERSIGTREREEGDGGSCELEKHMSKGLEWVGGWGGGGGWQGVPIRTRMHLFSQTLVWVWVGVQHTVVDSIVEWIASFHSTKPIS